MQFSGFESDPATKLDLLVVARFPSYGSIINVFIVDVTRRSLCVLYTGAPSGNVTLFYVPDWLETSSVHIDTGIQDVSRMRLNPVSPDEILAGLFDEKHIRLLDGARKGPAFHAI